ncbi:carbon storage regulator [Bremerella sp. JC817]|uniref:carbon storage regulator n=1 Tax=Bremerella sp. JC817 TaxID=3231756 RepID=UPI00345837A0
MLVLSRFPDQIIRIGENVMIKVVSIQGDKVRLGIEAPKDIEVHRQEVWLKLYGENEPDQGPSDSAA